MSYLFIANWKMRMHFNDAITYFKKNETELLALSTKHSLVVCPSFVALSPLIELAQNTHIHIGAQDCSPFKDGSHTGEVSAISLHEIGCDYCIVGHTERRIQFNETDESVAEKVIRLLENNIRPILCIGETETDTILTNTYAILERQLRSIFVALHAHKKQNEHFIIAYEPAWAIGTGVVPTHEYLTSIFAWLQSVVTKNLAYNSFQLIYGGSVDEKNCAQLKRIPFLQGFLIGGASANFAQFKAIV